MKLASMTVLALGLVLFGAACGGGSSPSASPTTTPPSASPSGGGPTTTTLTARDNVFDPTIFTFTGSKITLKNAGVNLHNFSVEGQNVNDDSKAGQTEADRLDLPPGTH